MYLAHKIKIQPNSHARSALLTFSHYSRDVYNRGLEIWHDRETAYFIEKQSTKNQS